jgi:hypothetical protein
MTINPVFSKVIDSSNTDDDARNIYCLHYKECLEEAARDNNCLCCTHCELNESRQEWDRRY